MPDLLKHPARALPERDLGDTERRSAPVSSSPFPAANPGADDASSSREDEANMRRALGMLGGSTRPAQPTGNAERRASGYNASNNHSGGQAPPRRHRFVQDGEVPVTVVRGRNEHAPDPLRALPASPVNRLDALQESLAAEQAGRATAERALEEAQTTIRTLQTRLSHLELARDEAQAQAQQALSQAAAAMQAQASEPGEPRPMPEAAAAKPVATTARLTRGKRQKPIEREPEPVKWWLSSQVTRTAPARRGRQRIGDTPE